MNKLLNIKVILIIFYVNNSFAQVNSTDEFHLDGYMLGITIRQMEVSNILMADIPLIEARVPLNTDVVQFKYGGQLLWGLSQFFVEWNYAAGLIIYPFGKYFGLNTTFRLGSFFFDNISYTGAIGGHLDFPLSNGRIISIGVEYFYRSSHNLLNYVSFPEYGENGEEIINLNSRGIGISVIIRY